VRCRRGAPRAQQPAAALPGADQQRVHAFLLPLRRRVQKKKIWEAVQPDLRTSAEGVAGWKGLPMGTSAGPVTVQRLRNGSIA
jgi:hypothetical protein